MGLPVGLAVGDGVGDGVVGVGVGFSLAMNSVIRWSVETAELAVGSVRNTVPASWSSGGGTTWRSMLVNPAWLRIAVASCSLLPTTSGSAVLPVLTLSVIRAPSVTRELAGGLRADHLAGRRRCCSRRCAPGSSLLDRSWAAASSYCWPL